MDQEELAKNVNVLNRLGCSTEKIDNFTRIQQNIDNLQYLVDFSSYKLSNPNYSVLIK